MGEPLADLWVGVLLSDERGRLLWGSCLPIVRGPEWRPPPPTVDPGDSKARALELESSPPDPNGRGTPTAWTPTRCREAHDVGEALP
jgi:hypothetical protein